MGKSVVHLDFAFLHELLQLPKECKILAIAPEIQGKYLEILIESDVLPEVAGGQPYPLAHVICTEEHHPEMYEFKKLSVRVEVYMPEAQGEKA